MPDFLADVPRLLDVLVNLTILAGGLAAAFKFRVFAVMAHRYRSEVWCTSTPVSEGAPGQVLFIGNFVIHNTGARPLKISRVTLSLLTPWKDHRIIDTDRADPIVQRQFGKDSGSSWFAIGAGERSIFPLRVYLDSFEGPLVFKCDFDWKHRGQPSEFAWLYDPRRPMTWRSEPTSALPAAWDPAGLPESSP